SAARDWRGIRRLVPTGWLRFAMLSPDAGKRVRKHEHCSYLKGSARDGDVIMSPILKMYAVLLPVVLGAALIEGLWIARTHANGHDWKEWATSLADVAVRRLLAFAPYGFLAPIFFWL